MSYNNHGARCNFISFNITNTVLANILSEYVDYIDFELDVDVDAGTIFYTEEECASYCEFPEHIEEIPDAIISFLDGYISPDTLEQLSSELTDNNYDILNAYEIVEWTCSYYNDNESNFDSESIREILSSGKSSSSITDEEIEDYAYSKTAITIKNFTYDGDRENYTTNTNYD